MVIQCHRVIPIIPCEFNQYLPLWKPDNFRICLKNYHIYRNVLSINAKFQLFISCICWKNQRLVRVVLSTWVVVSSFLRISDSDISAVYWPVLFIFFVWSKYYTEFKNLMLFSFGHIWVWCFCAGGTFVSLFEDKKVILEQKLDLEHGLMSKLVEYDVISDNHRSAVEVMFVTFRNLFCCVQLVFLESRIAIKIWVALLHSVDGILCELSTLSFCVNQCLHE